MGFHIKENSSISWSLGTCRLDPQSSERERVALLLVIRSSAHRCLLPLAFVVETMRPVPTRPLSGWPAYVVGMALIRGDPTPVVDLAAVLGAAGGTPSRLVTVRAGARVVALAVDEVLGVRSVEASSIRALPPLLSEAAHDLVSGIATLDRDFLLVLEAAKLLPDQPLAEQA